MYRGTTPTITINCDIDVSEFVTMWVTFRTQQLATYAPPKQVEVTKHLGDEGVDATDKVVTVSLTQADTLLLGSLSPDEDQQVEVQIRGRTEDGRAFASNIMTARSADPEGRRHLSERRLQCLVLWQRGDLRGEDDRDSCLHDRLHEGDGGGQRLKLRNPAQQAQDQRARADRRHDAGAARHHGRQAPHPQAGAGSEGVDSRPQPRKAARRHVVDSAGTVVIGEVDYLDDNTVRLTFCAAFSGTAYFN